ncbi:MAG: hypothetical protein ACLR76_07470 [Alistipes sp.]
MLKSVKGPRYQTAQKIIVELRDKIEPSARRTRRCCCGRQPRNVRRGAFGLTMLGFARQASEKVLRALWKEMPAATVEELVRQALKRL